MDVCSHLNVPAALQPRKNPGYTSEAGWGPETVCNIWRREKHHPAGTGALDRPANNPSHSSDCGTWLNACLYNLQHQNVGHRAQINPIKTKPVCFI
jgi:hypothetical protein